MKKQANPHSVYTVDEARQAVIEAVTDALPANKKTSLVPLAEAIDRVTANDIQALQSIPSFRNSAMDGYAIRFEDYLSSHSFQLVGKSLAGHPYHGHIPAQSAVRITTGAMLPANADTIVIQENTTAMDNSIVVNLPPEKHQYVRNPGDDIRVGEPLLAANSLLTAADTGLLAAQGIETVEVHDHPTIGVFSTGDELLSASQPLKDGFIYDSNRTSVCALLRKAGFSAVDLGIVQDKQTDIQNILNTSNVDFLLSTGGVSVGEADHVKAALEANGALNFWKVAMKPGKPMVTGILKNGCFYFGLPGNPVSAMVTCVQFVIPALRSYTGIDYQPPPMFRAVCDSDLTKEAGRFEFQRGIYQPDNGNLAVTTTGMQDSHVLRSMGKANCFICLDQQSTGVTPGEEVNIILFATIPGLGT